MYERNLIEYLPEFLRDIKENQAILTVAEQPEMVEIWNSVDNAMNDQFIADATENGVSRWEKILGITPKATESLDSRKFTILTRTTAKLPYTMTTLKEQLKSLCGEGNYVVAVDYRNYTLNVLIALAAQESFDDVEKLLKRTVPANMVINLGLKYSRHESLTAYTHEVMRSHTHTQLRNEVL